MSDFDAGYVVAFFEGEGTISFGRTKIQVRIDQNDLGPLTFIQGWLHDRGIHSRIHHYHTRPSHVLIIGRQLDQIKFLRLVHPHLKRTDKRRKCAKAHNLLMRKRRLRMSRLSKAA